MALRLMLSDDEMHACLSPDEPLARALFELFEQIRVESLPPPDMPGLARNLRRRYEQWSLGFHHSRLTETHRGILLYTVAQVCRAKVTAQPVTEATEALIEATRMAIAPGLGRDLAEMRLHRRDQAAYALPARRLAESVAEMAHSADLRTDGEQNPVKRRVRRDTLQRWLHVDETAEAESPGSLASADRADESAASIYRVFTTAYDRELTIASIVRAALLAEYRVTLDQSISRLGIQVSRLSRELSALFSALAPNGWDGSQEDGRIDGRRLPQLIASPTERRLFRTERLEPRAEGLVTFLIDCSGSMRRHIDSVATLIDLFVRALDQADVATEVLGFTTGAWNGGRAHRDWQRAGRPHQPGRLNELCHLVFKDADTPWRRARASMAGLMKSDLFREGVDGEAVDWACSRMDSRSATRRVLVVFSDGCPMDSATQITNGDWYLDEHLRAVVARAEQRGDRAIVGVGIGSDLSACYRQSTVLDLSAGVNNTVCNELVRTIAEALRACVRVRRPLEAPTAVR